MYACTHKTHTHNSKWSRKWDGTPCKSFFHWVTPRNVTPLKLQFRLLRRFEGTEGPRIQNKCMCVFAPRPFYHSIILSFSAVAAIFKNEIENGKAQRNLFRAWLLPLIVAEYINMNVRVCMCRNHTSMGEVFVCVWATERESKGIFKTKDL